MRPPRALEWPAFAVAPDVTPRNEILSNLGDNTVDIRFSGDHGVERQ